MPGWWAGQVSMSNALPSSARRAIRAPHSQSNQTVGPVGAGVQIAAALVLGEEGVQVGQQAHRREPTPQEAQIREVR
jgi:hypothetical protein